ncbi:MAG: transporter substrate-binding domain-containing protein, partial [Burkholderiales bacterium]|nr:transporter substrate-binding domain-containing protein [Burkholderiales bacterium]
ELARRSGCAFEYPVWSRVLIWPQLRDGRLDMTGSALETPDRSAYAYFANFHLQKNMLVVKAGYTGPATVGDILAADTIRFGAVHGYRYSPALTDMFDALARAGRLEEVSDQNTLYMRLALGRYQAIMATPASNSRYLPLYHLSDAVKVMDIVPQEAPGRSGLALSKVSFTEAQAAQWRDLVDGMRRDGTMRTIFARYLPGEIVDSLLKLD